MENNMSTDFKKPTDFSTHKRALNCIAQGCLTNSKHPNSFVKSVYPTHLKKGYGAHVWDIDGKKYVDFITGLGTNLLGYANETIAAAAIEGIRAGNTLSLGTKIEIKVAETLKQIFPFVDAWKFVKTGNEACCAALKIARTYQQKKNQGNFVVLSKDYHGHNDEFNSLANPVGVPPREWMKKLETNYHINDIAEADAVIIEAVVTDISDEYRSWLQQLREDCTKTGCILIFDEIVTGFRFPKFSVSNYWGIIPDLICIGKAMANGFSLSAVGGKYELMNQDYFVSSTFAGTMDALYACEKVLSLLLKDNRYKLDHLWEAGEKFLKDFNSLWPEKIRIEGYPTRGAFKGDDLTKALFFQECCYAGILVGPSFFFNFPLMEETFSVMSTFKDIIQRLKQGSVELEGEMPASPFAQKVREK
jgi:glutamate-1-semialdehyde aminotransferase